MDRKPVRDTTDILGHLRAALDGAPIITVGTADSNVNAVAQYAVPDSVIRRAIKEIEFLRSVAGAVTDGDSFADIRKAIKQS